MATITHEVEVDGQTQTIELDTDKLGVISKDELTKGYVPKDSVESIVTDRLKRATAGKFTVDELGENEELLKTIATKYGDPLKNVLGIKPGKGGGEPDEETLERLRQQIQDQEVGPLKKELDGLKSENDSLRYEKVRRAIAANPSIRDGLSELVELYYRDKVEWSPEHKQFFVKTEDGKGFEVSPEQKSGKAPWRTVDEDLVMKEASGKYGTWFDSTVRPGGGYQGGRPSSGSTTFDDFKKMGDAERAELARTNATQYTEFMEELGNEGLKKLGIA